MVFAADHTFDFGVAKGLAVTVLLTAETLADLGCGSEVFDILLSPIIVFNSYFFLSLRGRDITYSGICLVLC